MIIKQLGGNYYLVSKKRKEFLIKHYKKDKIAISTKPVILAPKELLGKKVMFKIEITNEVRK